MASSPHAPTQAHPRGSAHVGGLNHSSLLINIRVGNKIL